MVKRDFIFLKKKMKCASWTKTYEMCCNTWVMYMCNNMPAFLQMAHF
jgi:hypothetical protein